VSYAEVEVEVARLVAASRRPLSPHTRSTLAAYMQYTSGLTITEHCPDCGALLLVTELGNSAWSVSCPCGRSHDTLRGL
jgi:hypothetical protein